MIESAVLARLKHVAAGTGARRVSARLVEAWPREGLARGQLHELFADQTDDAGAAAGFALSLALVAGALPLLWLRTEAAERRTGRLSGSGAAELGLAPERLLLGLVADEAALLRAGADAARCAGLGTVLIEAWGRAPGLDLTATRRLMLAAEASGVTVLVLRADASPVPSAAATRWRVAAGPSTALAADAPGVPAFIVECLRRRGGPAGQRWCVEWNRESQYFSEQAGQATGKILGAPLSGAGLSVAADRAAALDPASPVRRAG